MGSWIYGKRRTQIPLSSLVTIDPLDDRPSISKIGSVYSNIKIASNTKINYIIVSFTDHYNAISIDTLPSKTKVVKDSRYFNNSLLRNQIQRYYCFIKNTKKHKNNIKIL